ncbi:protein shank [Trichonephila clavipes]|nr:protein shank [Trichonephila clavipes]
MNLLRLSRERDAPIASEALGSDPVAQCPLDVPEPGGKAMKAVAMDTAEDSLSQTSDEQLVSLQIYVPELIVQKCMQFNRDELIWDVKNQILAALPKELKEGFNYGLFCPPVNGRAGKFLDEERPLADYPFTDNSAYVEVSNHM